MTKTYSDFILSWVKYTKLDEEAKKTMSPVQGGSWYCEGVHCWWLEEMISMESAKTTIPDQKAMEDFADLLIRHDDTLKEVLVIPTDKYLYFYGRY